jgi:hypothetical protein
VGEMATMADVLQKRALCESGAVPREAACASFTRTNSRLRARAQDCMYLDLRRPRTDHRSQAQSHHRDSGRNGTDDGDRWPERSPSPGPPSSPSASGSRSGSPSRKSSKSIYLSVAATKSRFRQAEPSEASACSTGSTDTTRTPSSPSRRNPLRSCDRSSAMRLTQYFIRSSTDMT